MPVPQLRDGFFRVHTHTRTHTHAFLFVPQGFGGIPGGCIVYLPSYAGCCHKHYEHYRDNECISAEVGIYFPDTCHHQHAGFIAGKQSDH